MTVPLDDRCALRRLPEQGLDFLLSAAQGIVLERAGKGEQEQEHCAFAPRADAGAARRHRQHQEMHIDRALAQSLPNLLHREPASGQVGRNIGGNRP